MQGVGAGGPGGRENGRSSRARAHVPRLAPRAPPPGHHGRPAPPQGRSPGILGNHRPPSRCRATGTPSPFRRPDTEALLWQAGLAQAVSPTVKSLSRKTLWLDFMPPPPGSSPCCPPHAAPLAFLLQICLPRRYRVVREHRLDALGPSGASSDPSPSLSVPRRTSQPTSEALWFGPPASTPSIPCNPSKSRILPPEPPEFGKCPLQPLGHPTRFPHP